jgi:hypothetical protein
MPGFGRNAWPAVGCHYFRWYLAAAGSVTRRKGAQTRE